MKGVWKGLSSKKSSTGWLLSVNIEQENVETWGKERKYMEDRSGNRSPARCLFRICVEDWSWSESASSVRKKIIVEQDILESKTIKYLNIGWSLTEVYVSLWWVFSQLIRMKGKKYKDEKVKLWGKVEMSSKENFQLYEILLN